MHINYQCESNKFKLVDKINGNKYIFHYNVVEKMEEEKKFKNNSFVKTGRLIPTGLTESWAFVTNKKPSIMTITSKINEDIEYYIKTKILSGLVWNGYNVWLSQENQKNYSDWYALSVNEDEIPSLTAKFTKDGKNVYYEFSTKEEIKSLYVAMVKHINDCVNLGRKMKDEINLDEYKKCLSKL